MSAAKKTKDSTSNAFPNIDEMYEVTVNNVSSFRANDTNYLSVAFNTKNSKGVECVLAMIVSKNPNYTPDEMLEVFKIKTTEVEDKKYPKIEIEELA